MGSSIFTGSRIEIYSNFGIRDQKIGSKNGISLKKIYLATTLLIETGTGGPSSVCEVTHVI